MAGHHLILGEIIDAITGEVLQETHDERFRQNIAHILINKKGYRKTDIEPRRELMISACDKKALISIDFLIRVEEATGMIIRFGPGSLVTRHRPGLAVSRIIETYQIPVVVITNGVAADILNGADGKILRTGLDRIYTRAELQQLVKNTRFQQIAKDRIEMEKRIVYAYEIDDACPCDDTICHLT